MFRASQGPSSGSHNLFLTEVTGFCVRCQCLAAYPDPWCMCLSYRSRLYCAEECCVSCKHVGVYFRVLNLNVFYVVASFTRTTTYIECVSRTLWRFLRLNVPVSGYKVTKYADRYRPSNYVVIWTDSDVHYKQRRIIEFLSAENKSLENVHKRR
jgi:hypothetical protein